MQIYNLQVGSIQMLLSTIIRLIVLGTDPKKEDGDAFDKDATRIFTLLLSPSALKDAFEKVFKVLMI